MDKDTIRREGSREYREARCRRLAHRLGLAVQKDRARRVTLNHQGGYRVIDPNRNVIVAGERFDLSLDDLEAFLADRADERSVQC